MKAKICNGGLFLICKTIPVSEMFREPIAASWLWLPAAAGCMLMLFLPGEAQAEAVTGSRYLLWSVLERVLKIIPANCTPHFAVYLSLIRST